MYKTKKKQMAIVHAIKKKKQNKEALCATEIYEKSVWKDFSEDVECGELVLYGAGELFDYFCEVYGTCFEIKYAVDQKSRGEKKWSCYFGTPNFVRSHIKNSSFDYDD